MGTHHMVDGARSAVGDGPRTCRSGRRGRLLIIPLAMSHDTNDERPDRPDDRRHSPPSLTRRDSLKLGGATLAAAATGVGLSGTAAAAASAGSPPENSPIGGGAAYDDHVTAADATVEVSTKAGLLDALDGASSGDVVFVSGDARIDLTGEAEIVVPGGVTLASDRGYDGSPGALLSVDDYLRDDTSPDNLFKVHGDGVRLSGIRLRGPRTEYFDPDHTAPGFKDLIAAGIGFVGDDGEVDNCEIFGWTHAGVNVGSRTHVVGGHIHHNYIHSNPMEHLGYGVNLYNGESLIEYNYFDLNRHSISSYGHPTNGYEARYNLVGPHPVSHSFDMHGQDQSQEGDNVAGNTTLIHHNTFRFTEDIKGRGQEAIAIRGIPDDRADFEHNWFYHPERPDSNYVNEHGQAYRQGNKEGDGWVNVYASGNHFGRDEPAADVGHPRSFTTEQAPYGDGPTELPGRVQVEDFDVGGEGVSYHDTRDTNGGGAYRDGVGVDLSETDAGDIVLGYTEDGEWLEYTVDVPAATESSFRMRVSTPNDDRAVRVLLDGEELTTASVPNTGGWRNWTVVEVDDVSLPAGSEQVLRLEIIEGEFDLDWVEFVADQSPYGDGPIELPGRVEVEDFDTGGEGVAYHDTHDTNGGGAYRDGVGVDLSETDSGDIVLGYTEDGEWLEYTVDVPEATETTFRMRVSCPNDGRAVRVLLDGEELATASVPNTGGWRDWTVAEVGGVSLPAGSGQVLRLEIVEGEFDLDWVEFAVDQSVSVGAIGIDDDWSTQSLAGDFDEPVAIAKPVSYNGPNPAHVRLSNVGAADFDLRVEEWEYLDDAHLQELVSTLAVEAGRFDDGPTIQAGTIPVDDTLSWWSVSLVADFAEAPVVLTQTQTTNGVQAVVTRNRNVSTDSFETTIQEEENLGGHKTETVGYVAVEPGTGHLDGAPMEAGTVADVTDGWTTISFDRTYAQPRFLADAQTTVGINTAGLRYRNLTGDGVEVFVEEEESADDETAHVGETVGYVVVEGA